jgi:hypothetical protein
LAATQDAINVGGGATKDVCRIDSVGEQTVVSGDELRIRIDCRYVVSGCRAGVTLFATFDAL